MSHPAISLARRPMRRRPAVLAIVLLATTVCALLPAAAGAATLHATTSSFASTVASAQPGDTVLLASGSYGAWKGVTKTSPGITIAPESGATPSMSLSWDTTGSPAWLTLDGLTITDGTISGPSHDITIKNSTFPGYLQINPGASPGANNACGNCPAMNNNHIVFDNDAFTLASCPSGSCLGYEGRISFAYSGATPAGVQVKNSTFSTGCADGVQFVGNAGRGVTIGPGNNFTNLKQGSCGPHVDSIQFVGGDGATITGNYFSNVTTGVASYDGSTVGITVSDNVFASSEVAYPILFGGDNGAVIEHNTLAAGLHINLTSKQGASSRNETIRDNITPGGVVLANGVGGNATPTVNNYNICSSSCAGANSLNGTPSYVGPSSTYAGWALTSSSIGKGNASDGADRGIRTSSSPPPPPDTTAPDTTITSGPSGTTNDSTPTFAFSSSEANSVFECRVDSGSWASCTTPWTTAALADGAHSVSVRATDVAGNTDASPATRSFTVDTAPPPDTTAPDTSITSGPTGTTSDNTPTFAFTATETGSTFECRVDSGSWASCTTPWTTAALADGPHSVSVRATDAAGNTDASPATRSFTVATAPPPDTTAPDTTIGSGPNSATNDATPTFAFTATESGSTFQCRVDAGAWASCTSPWTTPTLSDGAHSVSVRATDAAGNTDGSPATRSFSVDTQAPNTTISSAPPVISPGSSATVAFSSNESGATFECQLDGGAWTACTSPKTYTGLTLGQHTAAVRAIDAAGNVDASVASASWTTVALPGLPLAAPAPSGAGGSGGTGSANQAPTVTLGAPVAGSTFTSTLNIAATASDDHGVSGVEFWVDGVRVARDTSAPYAASFAARRSTAYGVHTVAVRAFDAAGQARSAAVTVTRVRSAAVPKRKAARSSIARGRAATTSDSRQNVLVSLSLWRVTSAPADGGGTLLRGRGIPGQSATASLTRCDDLSGAVAAVMQLRAGADGTLYARQPAEGLCVLRVKSLGDA